MLVTALRSYQVYQTPYIVVTLNIGSSSAQQRAKLSKRVTASRKSNPTKTREEILQSLLEQMFVSDFEATKQQLQYHTITFAINMCTSVAAPLHGMSFSPWKETLDVVFPELCTAFQAVTGQQLKSDLLAVRRTNDVIHNHQPKYWQNCGAISIALVYMYCVMHMTVSDICNVDDIKDVYGRVTAHANGILLGIFDEVVHDNIWVCDTERSVFANEFEPSKLDICPKMSNVVSCRYWNSLNELYMDE